MYCATHVHRWVGCEVLSEKVVWCGCEVVWCGWVGGVMCCGLEGGRGHWLVQDGCLQNLVQECKRLSAKPTDKTEKKPTRIRISENRENPEILKLRNNKQKCTKPEFVKDPAIC